MPKFIGVIDNFIRNRKLFLKSKTDAWFLYQDRDNSYYYRDSGSSHVIMGRVAYPLDAQSIIVENFVKDDSKKVGYYSPTCLVNQTFIYDYR